MIDITRFKTRFLRHLLVCACVLAGIGPAHALRPAFYYGPTPFPQELRAFDTWVVEPARLTDPQLVQQHQDTLFAYVSLGEVTPTRPYFSKLPAAWLRGDNPAWDSRVIDQTAAGWPAFFVSEVITPLWQQGYRHFFLDTLDSYHLIASTPEARQQQEQGMIEAIRLLKSRYPQARLILNRGFEILPQVRQHVHAVAAESLFQSWNNQAGRYVPVSSADHAWLTDQLARVRDEYHLPVIVIDYAPPDNREQARKIAGQISALGFTPWVSDGLLAGMGVGAVDPRPRTILMLHDSADPVNGSKRSELHRFAAMPLNYLGYVPEYRSLRDGLPEGALAGRYAGIVTWFNTSETSQAPALKTWLLKQAADRIPIAALGYFGYDLEGKAETQLGLTFQGTTAAGKVRLVKHTPLAAFEIQPLPTSDEFYPLSAGPGSDVWLQTSDGTHTQDAVAITSWGGYALSPFDVEHLPDSSQARWVIDPIIFFKRALRLPDMPVPDVTTENGRRLLITHIDGDGFASRGEFPGSPWAAEVLYKEVLKRYPIPTTVSVIEGEISRQGLYPQFSSQLEPIARRMFALPHVEAASHSYSHPFKWQKLAAGVDAEEARDYSLGVPGYTFDDAREIDGSIRYVESLLPAGKQCKVFLWTGDCNPTSDTLARASRPGLLNMNGGDTLMSRTNPSLTAAAPLGLRRGELFQVYAPNQNENLYTNLWTGPYYGYERVIETFELTDKPLRIKPINIYYHTYSTSKHASLKALKAVYDWALKQPVLPIFASDYIRKVHDFNQLVVAREGAGWRIAGGDQVRTLRIPVTMGYPDLPRSRGVLGWRDEGTVRYIHLAGTADSYLVLADKPAPTAWLSRANARITLDRGGWLLKAYQPLELEFGNAARCTFRLDGKPAPVIRRPDGLFALKHRKHEARLEMRCAD
ncbi:MAG: endo alpha-1,4 polygalactosaminidase [Thiobacillus sp.]